MDIPAGDIDVLAIGEVVMDMISQEPAAHLREAETFRRYLGGSPANIAVYVAKLGRRSAIIGKTGIGGFGQFAKAELQRHGVLTDYLRMDHRVHTSVIFVARSTGTPDFEAFRDGDYQLTPEEVAEEAVARARIVHASTFALSREPCRSAVRRAFTLAQAHGKLISLDPNYSPVIWPNHEEARQVLADFYRFAMLTKPSLDDARRLFGPGDTPTGYIARFHALGPRVVVLTMGREGALVSVDGQLLGHVPARPIAIADATGAGDSFWAGFLTALLDGHPPARGALFAREIAELKLTTVGPLPAGINRAEVYARLPAEAALSPWPVSSV
ncbi:MAG: sugar kinase [Caldilineales bacterium]|nr:sugar kinase [Caldilineales bacterium]